MAPAMYANSRCGFSNRRLCLFTYTPIFFTQFPTGEKKGGIRGSCRIHIHEEMNRIIKQWGGWTLLHGE